MSEVARSTKDYLGDSVYAEVTAEGYIRLTTEDGINASNIIYLEPSVLAALIGYAKRYKMICITSTQ